MPGPRVLVRAPQRSPQRIAMAMQGTPAGAGQSIAHQNVAESAKIAGHGEVDGHSQHTQHRRLTCQQIVAEAHRLAVAAQTEGLHAEGTFGESQRVRIQWQAGSNQGPCVPDVGAGQAFSKPCDHAFRDGTQLADGTLATMRTPPQPVAHPQVACKRSSQAQVRAISMGEACRFACKQAELRVIVRQLDAQCAEDLDARAVAALLDGNRVAQVVLQPRPERLDPSGDGPAFALRRFPAHGGGPKVQVFSSSSPRHSPSSFRT